MCYDIYFMMPSERGAQPMCSKRLQIPVATMAGIVERVLRFPPIEADSDFFELGGDSITAAALAMEIEAERGLSAPIATRFEAPTPALLGAAATTLPTPGQRPWGCSSQRSGRHPSSSFRLPEIGQLTSVRSSGKEHPLSDLWVLRAGPRGHGTPAFARRAPDLALPPCPAHGTAARSAFSRWLLDGQADSLAARADAYPADEEVALPVLFDTYICPRRFSWKSKFAVWRRRLTHHAANLQETTWYKLPPFALARCGSLLGYLGITPRPSPGLRRPDDKRLMPTMQRVAEAEAAAAVAYRPRFYPGTITYFRARDSDPMSAYPDFTWRRPARKLVIHVVDGNHWQIARGRSADTARQFSECVRAVLATTEMAAPKLPAATAL